MLRVLVTNLSFRGAQTKRVKYSAGKWGYYYF